MPLKLATKTVSHPQGKHEDNEIKNQQDGLMHPLLQLSHQIGNQALQHEIIKPQKGAGVLLEDIKESKGQPHEGAALVQRVKVDEQALPVPQPVPMPGVEGLSGTSLDDVRQHYGPY